ncbi:STAS domain-containing protein [Pseudonocardia charpentierae]|uniref:STAS domain-containing protein n=1 Tax=Pseudonocardia charpentierae TaxID=3075545 RepID=A0ABU2NJG2_9PSEU|nr:STAS domain-containing protein [Pseudonocardia sp. DSM 45834]MDT0353339.1 STAS domain-containing protein [Pseudonocardia sp. DSM 45834]
MDRTAHVEVAHRSPGYVLVRVHGEVDLNTHVPLVEAVDQTDADATAPVVVDLHPVRFFSLGGVDWLAAALSAFIARGRRVRVVCRDRGPAWRLIDQLRLDRHWPLHHEVSDAVDSLDLPRPMPSSPGAADARLQGRSEPDSICPLDGACALAVGLRSETSSGAIRPL